MIITENIAIKKDHSTGLIVFTDMTNTPNVYRSIRATDDNYNVVDKLYNVLRAKAPGDQRKAAFDYHLTNNTTLNEILYNTQNTTHTDSPIAEETPKEKLVKGLRKLMDFFSEFDFIPSFRFANTFAYYARTSKKAVKEFVHNYFALMDSGYTNEVTSKMKSAEFDTIVDTVAAYGAPASKINSRFKIYYGSAGTGKTTLAQKESENRCIVCNSSMLPADLMEDFIFKDGNPDFNPSLLWDCMEQGKTIVLDEINLLPFDSLRFLQGIVDGKTEFYYKNRPVHIHEGFQIIGTMNLSLGGVVYGLPEPLVDRCCNIKEFTLTPEQLALAITGAED